MDSTTMKGTVQGYFDGAFDEMTDKELETSLANSGLGVKAKLAPNSGTFVQLRKFGDLALATEANSDSPKMYGETEEPSTSMVVPDEVFQVSTQDLPGYRPLSTGTALSHSFLRKCSKSCSASPILPSAARASRCGTRRSARRRGPPG